MSTNRTDLGTVEKDLEIIQYFKALFIFFYVLKEEEEEDGKYSC